MLSIEIYDNHGLENLFIHCLYSTNKHDGYLLLDGHWHTFCHVAWIQVETVKSVLMLIYSYLVHIIWHEIK